MAPKRQRHQARISYRCGRLFGHSQSGIQKSVPRECKTSFSSFHGKGENGIVYEFKNSADAREFMTRLEGLRSSPFVTPKFSAQQGKSYHVVGSCKMGHPFVDWWKSNFENFWELSQDDQGNYKIVALTKDAKKLFRDMLEGLKVYHNASIGHGNLRNGVMVTQEGEIQFFNEAFELKSFDELLLDDLKSFKDLVVASMETVEGELLKSGKHIKAGEHPAVKAFGDLYKNLSSYMKSSKKLMEFDFYVRNNPLFMNTKQSFLFLKKIVDIREFYPPHFNKLVSIGGGDTNLRGWGKSINHEELLKVFGHKSDTAEYAEAKGAILFVRNVLWHVKDNYSSLDYGIMTDMILEDLPQLLPKLWLALIRSFGARSSSFSEYSLLQYDLIGFLRKEPSCMD